MTSPKNVCIGGYQSVVKGAQMAMVLASDWSSDVMTGSGMGYR